MIGHYYQSFAMLQREIHDYNQQLKRYLSVIFTLITVTITYIHMGTFVTLSVLIIGCNMIKQNNVKHCDYNFETITSIQLNQPSGFQLGNGVTITSYTFVTFLVNIKIKLWKKLMKFHYYRKFHNQFFYIYFYDELLQKQIIENNYPIDKKPIGKIMNPPHHHPIFFIPLVVVMFIAYSYMYLFEWVKNYQFDRAYIGLLPKDGINYLMVTAILWGINALFNGFYASSRYYQHFHFLLPILHQRYCELNTNDSNKYALIRNCLLSLIRIGSSIMCILLVLGIITMSIQHSTWQISIFWSFTWIFTLLLYSIHVVAAIYHISSIIFLAQYYLNLRQKSHGRTLQRFYGQLSRYERKQRIHQNSRQFLFGKIIEYYYQSFAMLQREIRDFNQQLKRYLSCISITIHCDSKCTLYVIISIDHWLQYDRKNNVKTLRLQRKCLTLSSTCKRKLFHNYQLFKFETITSIQMNQPSGFELGNGVIITSYTFVTFLVNISSFFFLISQVHSVPDISTQISGTRISTFDFGNIRYQFGNLEYDKELAVESGAAMAQLRHPTRLATIASSEDGRQSMTVTTSATDLRVIRHATNYENGHDHEESSCTRYLLDSSEYDGELAEESGAVTARLRHPTRLATIALSEGMRQSMTVATIATDLWSRQSTKVATIAQVPRRTRTFHRSGDDRIAMDIRQTRKVATIALNQWRHSTRLATIAPSENGRQSMTEATIALNQ
ncbi:hypothetical protein DERF_001195 [Dermatophagoides farinae]|uniref:Uncharacterized protein n=1 Tax=Dermatophagoides farinae TaxID=6954 RepID=A0A922LCW1_DERFA|nr:hypothetical protein DERF_001195 [Dermatophagoides farinae]